jgi:hypothetical protein
LSHLFKQEKKISFHESVLCKLIFWKMRQNQNSPFRFMPCPSNVPKLGLKSF